MSQKAYTATLTFNQTHGCKEPTFHPLFSPTSSLKPSTLSGDHGANITDVMAADLLSSPWRATEPALPIVDGWETPRLRFVLIIDEPRIAINDCFLRHTLIGYTEAADLGGGMQFDPRLKMFLDRVIVTYHTSSGPVHTVGDYTLYAGREPTTVSFDCASLLHRLAGAESFGDLRFGPGEATNLIGVSNSIGLALRETSDQSIHRYIDNLRNTYAATQPDNFLFEEMDGPGIYTQMSRSQSRMYANDNVALRHLLYRTDLAQNGYIRYSELVEAVTLTKVELLNPTTPPCTTEPATDTLQPHAIAAAVVNAMNGWMGWYGINELTMTGKLTRTMEPLAKPVSDNIKYFGSGQVAEDVYGKEPWTYADPELEATIEERLNEEFKYLAAAFNVDVVKFDAQVDLFGDAIVRISIDNDSWTYYHRPMYASALSSPLLVNVADGMNLAELLFKDMTAGVERSMTTIKQHLIK